MNVLFKLIKKYNLEDELGEIYPYNKKDYEIKIAIFRKFVDKIIGNNESIEEGLVKLFYFYSQSIELKEFFLEESPIETDGIDITKNIIEKISKYLLNINSLNKVKKLLLKQGIDLDNLLKEDIIFME